VTASILDAQCHFFLNLTPAPPPFSGMNSTPADSSAARKSPRVSLGFQYLVSDQPVTDDQSDGFRSRNIMLGNKLIDARQHVRLKADHDRHTLSSWGRAAPFL
jgi:hypothetical protein